MNFVKAFTAAIGLSVCISFLASAATQNKDLYTIQSGKGWAVCEAYTKALNALPAEADFPYCSITDLKAAGVSLPRWEVLSVEENLPLLHRIELEAWNSYRYEATVGNRFVPPAEFETWKVQRLERIRQLQQIPRLRKIRMPLVESGQMETMLVYDGDTHACQQSEQRIIKLYGHRVGEASSPMKRLLDEKTGRLIGGPGWDVLTWGEIVMHRHRPYLVMPATFEKEALGLVINRFESAVEDRPEFREQGNSGYLIHELCRIVRSSPLTSPLSTQPSTQPISR